MTWNYRVLREVTTVADEPHESFSIIEVYYDAAGNIESWAEPENVRPGGDNLIELASDLTLMSAAIAKPVLNRGDLPG